jgi:hypothetical protein
MTTESKKQVGQVLSRRSFLTGLASVGLAAAGVAGAGTLQGCAPRARVAGAEELPVAQGNWYGEPASLDSFSIIEELDCDVLVCGAGHGGMIGTLAAAEAGAKTLLIEKGSTFSAIREYWGLINAQCQKDAGVTIDPFLVTKELMRYASYRADQRLIKLWVDESGETADWLINLLSPQGFSIVAEPDVASGYHDIYPVYPIQCNVQIPGNTDVSSPTAFKQLGQAILEAAQGFGAEVRYDTSVVQCIVEDDRVVGAIIEGADGYRRVNAAKGVLIATGGYEGNTELLEQLQPRTCELIAYPTNLPQNVGEGIIAGIWAGGRKDEQEAVMLFDRGAVGPDQRAGHSDDSPATGSMFWMGSQPWLKVNLKGERFCNECAPYDFPIHAVGLDAGNTWCSIWDANWIQNIETFHTVGCSRIAKSPTDAVTQEFLPPIIEAMNADMLASGIIQQSDTIEGLAEKLDIPVDAFAATVERYNGLAADGLDEDFGKPAKDMIGLNTPPFYGVRQGAALYCTLDGLRINADCAVIDKNDDAIPGLWAAGNATGGFFAANYPELVIGCACARTMTQARHAVLNMLGEK